jgi:hypothetical protein
MGEKGASIHRPFLRRTLNRRAVTYTLTIFQTR